MPKEIVVWDAVRETGTALTSLTNFVTSARDFISLYRTTSRVDKIKAQQLIIESNKIIKEMKDTADCEITVNQMQCIQKAVDQARAASDPVSRDISMKLVAKLANKYFGDY